MMVTGHAQEVDRIAKIENRIDQFETSSKRNENVMDEKLKYYVTDKYIQGQLAKLQLQLGQIENTIGGDSATTARQLTSTVVEIQSRMKTMESRFVKFKEDAEALTHRSIRELAREVHSAKRSAVSRMMMQTMEREKYSNSGTISPKPKSATFFGDVDKDSTFYDVNMDNEQISSGSVLADVSTSESLAAQDSPTLKPLDPRTGGVTAEDSATIRSLDAR